MAKFGWVHTGGFHSVTARIVVKIASHCDAPAVESEHSILNIFSGEQTDDNVDLIYQSPECFDLIK